MQSTIGFTIFTTLPFRRVPCGELRISPLTAGASTEAVLKAALLKLTDTSDADTTIGLAYRQRCRSK